MAALLVGVMPGVYFNDNEPFVIPWLGNLYPEAVTDGRSIVDVQPQEVSHYDRAHFFAGIGGWQYALDLAGWPAIAPVWTGSLPCQPFSAAGRRQGKDDERHLWPEFRRLIAECRPPVIFGEQVASNLGREWLAGVRADLEALGYAVGAADLCAASTGAPHIRQRLYWVAYAERDGLDGSRDAGPRGRAEPANGGSACGLADASIGEMGRTGLARQEPSCRLADADSERREEQGLYLRPGEPRQARILEPWSSFDVLYCTDGKARRIEPGTFPLAHGIPARVGRIRAYGGSIVPQVAATFIRAFMEATHA